MPSSKNYKRNYKQERRTAKKRGETGQGSKSGDAKRHRARRAALKRSKNPSAHKNQDLDHKKPLKSGGSNSAKNTRWSSKKSNRSRGGKIGNKAGKSRGGKKGKR